MPARPLRGGKSHAARFLVASTPAQGHVAPLLRAAAELTRRSHEVCFLTGSRFASEVLATGARHVPLPVGADYDDRDLDGSFPGRASKRGVVKFNFDVIHLFAKPIADQFQALEELRRTWRPEAVLGDTAFAGAAVWPLAELAGRPPVALANVTYLNLSGPGLPPAGLGLTPLSGPLGRIRDSLASTLGQRVLLRSALNQINRAFEETAGRRFPGASWDGPLLADRLLVLTIPSVEYLRPTLPQTVRLVGPVLPPPATSFDEPS